MVNKMQYKLYADDLNNIYQRKTKPKPIIPNFYSSGRSEFSSKNFINDEFKINN